MTTKWMLIFFSFSQTPRPRLESLPVVWLTGEDDRSAERPLWPINTSTHCSSAIKKKVIFIEAYWMRQKIWKTHKPSKNTHRNTCFESHVTCYMSHVESPELGHQSKPKCGEYFSMNYYSVTTITKNDTAQPWLHRSAHNPHRISPGHSEVRFFFFATCNLQLYKKQKWEFTPPRPQLSFENGLIYVEI